MAPRRTRQVLRQRRQAAGTSGDSEIRLSPAKPEPDQKKARRVKRRRGPRRTRLGPSPNETGTKDDTQRLDEKPAGSAGEDGRAAKHFKTAEPAPPAPADSGAASRAIMSALACRSVAAAAALIAAIGATLAAGVTEWAGAGI